jgi:hypothetical protein
LGTQGGLDPSPDAPPPHRVRVPIRPLAYGLLAVGLVALLSGAYLVYGFVNHERRSFPHGPPPQTDVSAIQGWMTLPYVARAYHVPEPELFKAVGADPRQAHDLSLFQIADQQGKDRDALVESVRQAVSAFQAAHPPPPTRPPAS